MTLSPSQLGAAGLVNCRSEPRKEALSPTVAIEDELEVTYNSEINLEIGWFWECGITINLGDPMNGYLYRPRFGRQPKFFGNCNGQIARHYRGDAGEVQEGQLLTAQVDGDRQFKDL